jgi:hypothetical protein
MVGRSESDYREVVFEREGKEPLHGFMRVDRGMVIVSGYGRHKESRVGSSPPELSHFNSPGLDHPSVLDAF